MNPQVSHSIKYRKQRGKTINDDVMTPPALAAFLVELVPFTISDYVLDPFRGDGAFHNALPIGSPWAEIRDGKDFFDITEAVDWCVSNPPYSQIDHVLDHTAKISRKGFAYLLAVHAITPRRLQILQEAQFGLTKVHLCKVFRWYGMSAFCVFERNKIGILNWDRIVWR